MPSNIERLTESANAAPLTQPLPPNRLQSGRFGGEEKLVGTLTQGGAKGSCPSLALGYFLMPFSGLSRGSSGLLPLRFSKNASISRALGGSGVRVIGSDQGRATPAMARAYGILSSTEEESL